MSTMAGRVRARSLPAPNVGRVAVSIATRPEPPSSRDAASTDAAAPPHDPFALRGSAAHIDTLTHWEGCTDPVEDKNTWKVEDNTTYDVDDVVLEDGSARESAHKDDVGGGRSVYTDDSSMILFIFYCVKYVIVFS